MRLALASLALASLAGCSSDPKPAADGGGACAEHVVAAGTDLATPVVSFATDVRPILQGSCGLSSSCHGGSRPPLVGRNLDARTMRANLLVKSTVLASMAYVAPGDAKNSLLQRKMDGDQCMLDAQCAGRSCGEAMPQGGGLLPVAERDTVRRWIAQGAADN